MLNVVLKSRFKKDLKKLKSAKWNEDELIAVIEILAKEELLAERFRDHALTGNYVNHRECHVRPDWLLIYRIEGTDLMLVRTGSHSELY
jgi:mRNA interferase YafQ